MLELPAMLGISAGTNVMNTAANWYWQNKNYNYQKIFKISYSLGKTIPFKGVWLT